MLCGHGPVIGGIAIGVDGAVGRSDPVAATRRRCEDGGRRVHTPTVPKPTSSTLASRSDGGSDGGMSSRRRQAEA